MKHTEGQWSINNWPQGDTSIGIGAIGTPIIAKVLLRDVSINEQKANAQLIASAPDLLEACIELINQKDNGVKVNDKLTFTAGMVSAMLKIQEAINKATL